MATATIANKASKRASQKKYRAGGVATKSSVITAILFALPFLVLFCVFTIGPVVTSIYYSLTNFDLLQSPKFIGFENYKNLFLNDELFILALRNTFYFACISGPIGYIMSFVMAWVLNDMKGRNIFALAFYAPSITSGTAMGVVWGYFFSDDRYGLINNVLTNLGVISEPMLWKQNPETILPVCIFIQIWMSMGTGFLVFMAGLQNQDRELIEAGSLDGIKTRFQELYYITLPQMKPQLLFGAINTISGAFGVFDVITSFAGFPTPNYAGHTLVAHLYDYAFIKFEMGYASAIAVILFAITYVVGKLCIWMLTEKD